MVPSEARAVALGLRLFGWHFVVSGQTAIATELAEAIRLRTGATPAAPGHGWPILTVTSTQGRSTAAFSDGVGAGIGTCHGAAEIVGAVELTAAACSPDYVAIHAGVVAYLGRTVLLPGRSFAGKSTLTAALVRRGAEYFSDEYALLRPDGLVCPYPRPLGMRQAGARLSTPTDVATLGGHAATEDAHLGLVARLNYDESGGWVVRPMSPAECVLALVDNAVPAQLRPAATLDAITRAVMSSPASGVTGTRGAADEAAIRLMRMLET